MRVGVVGVGTMGSRVVARFVEHGWEVVARDIDPAAEDRARALGATVVGTPAEVARRAQLVLLSLPMPSDVSDVVRGQDGIVAAAGPEHVVVDLSTVDPGTSARSAEALAARGARFLDAPVLGRPQGCGNWTLVVGGSAETVERVRPHLGPIAARIVHVGETGRGNVVKLLNNLMFAAINSATAEIVALCQAVGMDPQVMFDAIAGSGAASVSNLFRELVPRLIREDFSPVFSVDLLAKDISLGVTMGRDAGIPMVMGSASLLLTEMARALGAGRDDSASVVKAVTATARRPAGAAPHPPAGAARAGGS